MITKFELYDTLGPRVQGVYLKPQRPTQKHVHLANLTRAGKHAWQHSLGPHTYPSRHRALQSIANTVKNTRALNNPKQGTLT